LTPTAAHPRLGAASATRYEGATIVAARHLAATNQPP